MCYVKEEGGGKMDMRIKHKNGVFHFVFFLAFCPKIPQTFAYILRNSAA